MSHGDAVASTTTTAERPGRGSGTIAPVFSMTGFARVAARAGEAPALTLTLKSINHRFLDLQLRLPAGADALEAAIRAALKRELARGHVECTLTLDRAARRDTAERSRPLLTFDMAALAVYVRGFREAAAALGLAAEPDLNQAALLPGILAPAAASREGAELDDDEAALDHWLAAAVPPLLDEALAALKAMRAREGAALVEILRGSLARLSGFAEEIASLRGAVQSAQYAHIAGRLESLVGSSFSRDRVLAEAALIAERGDVEEEVARMHTHIDHFHALLAAGGETGKKLDFLLQEMNREANTLLSKTGGLTGGGARITECGLAMKAEIEKLREQVQNIE